ncbi:hypothetical protein LC593_33420 [Nostoc sp. CHAB 5844]|nr:hypothetical protein [Nostoc sp. CHAB 5844]
MTLATIDAQAIAQFELEQYIEQQAQELAPEFEIDSTEDEDFGTLYRVWKSFHFLGSFYQSLDGKWVVQPVVALTKLGKTETHSAVKIHELDQLHQAWYDKLSNPQTRIVKALISVYPRSLDRETLASKAGVSSTSSGYTNNLGALRSLGIIDYPNPGRVVATSILFPEK